MFQIIVAYVMRFYYMLCKRKVILIPANKAHGEVELKLKKLLNSTMCVCVCVWESSSMVESQYYTLNTGLRAHKGKSGYFGKRKVLNAIQHA
jgi:hypothetical protein